MKKILVLGDKGMLGHVVKRYLENTGKYEVIGTNRNEFDARNLSNIDKYLNDVDFDYIINCIGILNNSNDLQLYADVNIFLPRYLAKKCTQRNAKLIHISTNCVFKDIGPHNSDEVPNATDLYGMSKAFGEINDDHNLTIRTSIFGPELKKDGIGLFNQFMQGKINKGFENIFYNGITSLELAKLIEDYMENKTGILNLVSSVPKSKYHILNYINIETKLNINLKKEYKNMHQSLLEGTYTSNIELQIEELISWMKENKDLYEDIYELK